MSFFKKNSNNISIIFNEDNNSPKYFELKKSHLVIYFLIIPLFFILSGTLFFIFSIKNFNNSSIIVKEKIKIVEKIIPCTTVNVPKSLPLNCTQKSVPAITGQTIVKEVNSHLGFFLRTPTHKNLTDQKLLNLTDLKSILQNGKIHFKFNIIPKLVSESKIQGNIFVIMNNEQGIQLYPKANLDVNTPYLKFSEGEPFLTQRFRPVDAFFFKPSLPGNFIFTIAIFSSNGDLIHYQQKSMAINF